MAVDWSGGMMEDIIGRKVGIRVMVRNKEGERERGGKNIKDNRL